MIPNYHKSIISMEAASWVKYNGSLFNPDEFINYMKERIVCQNDIEFKDPAILIAKARVKIIDAIKDNPEQVAFIQKYFQLEDRITNFWIDNYNNIQL